MVWRTIGWSGISIGPAAAFSWQRGERGEDRGHQVVGLHALDRRRVAPAAALAQDHERAAEVPPPPHLEHRREQERLGERLLRRPRREEARHLLERQALAGPEREHHRVVARRRLQLEVEAAAEALAEGEAERAVDAAAERRVDHELHPARLVEEALEDEVLLGREDAEGELRGAEVADDLRGGDRRSRPHSRLEPRHARPARSLRGEEARRRARGARETSAESSAVRAGASPSQNGTEGGAPCASTTRTMPASTRRMRHEVLPRRNVSPAMLSMAQSSFTVPTTVSSGSATTL